MENLKFLFWGQISFILIAFSKFMKRLFFNLRVVFFVGCKTSYLKVKLSAGLCRSDGMDIEEVVG